MKYNVLNMGAHFNKTYFIYEITNLTPSVSCTDKCLADRTLYQFGAILPYKRFPRRTVPVIRSQCILLLSKEQQKEASESMTQDMI